MINFRRTMFGCQSGSTRAPARWIAAALASASSRGTESKKATKRIRCQASVSCNPTHRKRIHRVVAGNRHEPLPIGHHGMLALANDLETDFLKNANRLLMAYIRNAWPRISSNRDGDRSDIFFVREKTLSGLKILFDGDTDVRKGLLFSGPLRPASR